MSNEILKEKVITKIFEESGEDKATVRCWFENYQTVPCRAIQGCCNNMVNCKFLEEKGFRNKWG